METFEDFREALRDALAHLHDPDYQPPELMAAVIGCDPRAGTGPAQSAIIDLLANLKSTPDVAGGTRASRAYETLYLRFAQRLSQEETAERLHMSVRHLRRLQREATHIMARFLWEHSLAREASVEAAAGLDWRAQLAQDMASLQKSVPGAVADVGETIRSVVALEQALSERHGVTLAAGAVEPGLIVPAHPSALRQVLIMAVGQLLRRASSGSVTISAERLGEEVRITLAGPNPPASPPLNGESIGDLLAPLGGLVEVVQEADRAALRVRLPSAGEISVLVVDDNVEMVHFYQRCTRGTRYRITHLAQGQRVLALAKAKRPDIIVLDIMLPDVDGWELLSQLYDHPTTRSIPVVVSSVIREEELALALGAAVCIIKPIPPEDFVQALDQALDQALRQAAANADDRAA